MFLQIRLMNCAKCNAIPHARCNMRMSKALEKSVRIDFDAMVLDIERITGGDQRGVCSCADGFLPIKSAVTGWITKCHDPIVLSSVVGSRCGEKNTFFHHIVVPQCVTKKIADV